MAKSMRNKMRELSKLNEERVGLVKAALEAGCYTRSSICKATELKPQDLTNLFTANPELRAEYNVKKKLMADIAADNVFDILLDPRHPQHFQASKYILANYKSDVDDNLVSQEGDSISLSLPGGEVEGDGAEPVVIKFSKGKDDG